MTSSFPEPMPASSPELHLEGSSAKYAERELYARYLPVVRRIAMRLVRKLPNEITIDDLLGAGWVGLVEALRRRATITNDDEFEAYAAYRIRGAILDYLRSLDPMTRRMRGASRQITNAIKSLTTRLRRAPTEVEIAGELGIDLVTYQELLHEVAQADPTRIELSDLYSAAGPAENAPDLQASRREFADKIAYAIDDLPERLRIVLGLYYQEDCSLREIGEVLGVTESRACQLHSEAIHRIRAALAVSMPPPPPDRKKGRPPGKK